MPFVEIPKANVPYVRVVRPVKTQPRPATVPPPSTPARRVVAYVP